MLASLGYRTASADEIARDVFLDHSMQTSLRALFDLPELDRAAIREAIAAKPALRREMNALMHPAIWERILHSGAQFVEIPLLVEACLHPRFRVIWMVTCGHEEQLRRLTERLGSVRAADQLLSTQLSSRAKAQFADRIVRTNAERDDVLAFVTSVAGIDVAR